MTPEIGKDSHLGPKSAISNVMKLVEPVILALALATLSFAQQDAANRVAQAPTASPGIVDHVLDWVGPIPSTSPARPEKFSEFVLSTVGPVAIFGEAAGAGLGQWDNAPKEWGQGWGAYGKRFASNMAYNGVRQSITYAGSLAFGEDTRYVSSTASGIWPRTRHALVTTFTARHANGNVSFSISSTAGVIGAAAIQSTWGPDSWKGIGAIGLNAGVSMVSTAGLNVVREFLPDLFRRPRR